MHTHKSPGKPLKIRAASQWLRRGASLVALHPSAKTPIEKGWPSRPIKTQAEIDQLFKENPRANYGIITGSVSGFIIIDVDGPVGSESLKDLQVKHRKKIPPTVTVMTGRGFHLIFRYRGPRIGNSVSQLCKNVDARGDGGYAVGVGSLHPDGSTYEYAEGRGPASRKIADLPNWIAEILIKEDSPTEYLVPERGDREGNTLSGGLISEPGRNQHLTSVAGRLHNSGISSEALTEALWVENQQKCNPPLERDEVEKVARSVSRYAPKNRTGDEAEDLMQTILDAHFSSGATLIHAVDSQFWSFNGTHWSPLPRKTLEGIVLKAIQLMPLRGRQKTASLITQTMALLSAATAAVGDVLRFNATPAPIINCANGELHIQKNGKIELKPHSPSSYLRTCLTVQYDPQATCLRYDRAVAQIFSAANDAAALTAFWHEIMGYAIQSDRRTAAIVLGRGSGSNGKTALIETAIRLVGREQVAAMPVQDLDKSRFTIGGLLDKLLIVDDDMKAGTRLPDGELKRISESKTVTGEHKFGQPFTFTVRTLPILLFNNPPSLSDLSHGMRRRLLVVPFEKTFKDDDVDKTLFPMIWASEMSGVLNRFLAGLARFIERGWNFQIPDSAEQAKAELLIEANPLPAFIEYACRPTKHCWLADLYVAFVDWANRNGITRQQQKSTFKRNLQNSGYEIVHGNRGDKVIGLSLNTRG